MRSERIEKLRQHALSKGKIKSWDSDEYKYLNLKGWAESSRITTHIGRVGYRQEYVLSHETPVIDDGELIVGKYYDGPISEEAAAELELLTKYGEPCAPRNHGQNAHMAVDYEKLLKKGVKGVISEINEYIDKLDDAEPEDLEKKEFYEACFRSLNGLLKKAENYSVYAADLAEKCEDSERRSELIQISENLKNVPANPAKTFWEALQSVHFLTCSMKGLYQWGRPDAYLIEYYRNDLKKGVLTKDFAQELINSACVMFNEYIYSGLAVGFMVGGRDKDGNDLTNELTYMFLESIRDVSMIYPGIGLCYHSDTPFEIKKLACELLSEGHSHPALFNDETITDGLKYYGLPADEACNYIHSTCVEITPCNSSAVWVASPYTNLIQLLLDVLGVKEVGSEPVEFESMDALKDAYRNRLAEHIRNNCISENRNRISRMHSGGDPLVSCFVNDCLSVGKDIDMGGARYNWIMPSFVGAANLADSFSAIEKLIFEEKDITFAELAKALESDFVGYEELFKRINKIPKYGNDIDSCDCKVDEICDWILEETNKYTAYFGSKFIPSLFCWIMHDEFGKKTMASPDGRRKGFPLGDGSGPAQGREENGPTASILSSTKWDHKKFIGGIAVNLKFSSVNWDKDNINKFISLIDVFMARGGFELQVNSVNLIKLIAARKNPEQYKDLVVRIGGYSDFFVRLSDTMQREVIARTGHGDIDFSHFTK